MKAFYKSMSLSMIFIVSILFTLNLHMPLLAGVAYPQPQPPMPTQEELLALERDLQAKFEEEYKNLSTEEKKEVDAYMERLSKMTEDELFEEIEREFEKMQKQIEQEQKEAAKPVEQPVAPATPVKEEKLPEPEPDIVIPPCKETDNILDLVNSLIQHTNSFMLKANIIPDFSRIVASFNTHKSRKSGRTHIAWPVLKEAIESFVLQLYTMREKDPKTKQYRSVDAFANNTSLCNNLNKLRSTLQAHEAKIEAPKFGLGDISAQSEAAIERVVDAYIEALYMLDIPETLDKVLKAYEPRAKKLRKDEEDAQKRALEDSKKGRPFSRPTEVVRGRDIDRYAPSPIPYSGGYNPYPGGGYDPYPGGHFGGYEPTSPASGAKPSQPKGGGSGGGSRPGKEKDDAHKDESAKKGGGKSGDKKSKENLLSELDTHLRRVADILGNPAWNDPSKYVPTVTDAKKDEFAVIHLPEAIKQASRALDAMKAVKRSAAQAPRPARGMQKRQAQQRTSAKEQEEIKKGIISVFAPYQERFTAFMDNVKKFEANDQLTPAQKAPYQAHLHKLTGLLAQLMKESGLEARKKPTKEEEEAELAKKKKELEDGKAAQDIKVPHADAHAKDIKKEAAEKEQKNDAAPQEAGKDAATANAQAQAAPAAEQAEQQDAPPATDIVPAGEGNNPAQGDNAAAGA